MNILIRILFILFPFTIFSQDIKKVDGVTDTNIKKVSGVSDTNIKKVNGVNLVTTTPLLLDNYPGASIAYSIRKLDKDYTGNCINIKRVSDNSTTNIGFDTNGNLDQSAISSFCSGTTCYVMTWYDQSGNSRNLTTASNGWRIYNSGAVEVKYSKPNLANIEVADLTVSANENVLYGTNAVYGIVVGTYKSNAGSGSGYIYDEDTPFGILDVSEELTGGVGTSFSTAASSPVDNRQEIVEYSKVSSTEDNVYKNGTQLDSGNSGSASFTPASVSRTLHVGGNYYGSTAKGMQEFILYPSNQSSNRSAIYTDVSTAFPAVIPDAVNWATIDVTSLPSDGDIPQPTQTISGITAPITLQITFGSGLSLEYKKNGGSWVPISNEGTISMSNGDNLKFQMTAGVSGNFYTVTVKNATADYATLDTFGCIWVEF